jgi:hypothetical protein
MDSTLNEHYYHEHDHYYYYCWEKNSKKCGNALDGHFYDGEDDDALDHDDVIDHDDVLHYDYPELDEDCFVWFTQAFIAY